MADTKVSALTQNATPLGGDLEYNVDDPTGTPASKYNYAGDKALFALAPVQGGLINGYISRTVASNNLTVAVKTLSGGDPSATDPVYVRIGNTVRKITAALSVTKNAGTNWCNAGGAELATIEVDYFVYMGYNATDGTVIGFSRIPNGRTYGSFSTTSTDYNYAAISTITTADSADEYEVVGRFNATLSAGAGYTWSVPGTSIVVSRPILQTRWLTWAPTITGFSANPTDTSYRYMLDNNRCFVHFSQQTNGTSNATSFTATTPISAANVTNGAWGVPLLTTVDNNTVQTTPGRVYILVSSSRTTFTFNEDAANGSWTNSSGKRAVFEMWYEI